MGKASSMKKVTRAASTGGGRTSRGRTPWLWYLSIALVCALGIAGIAQSRHQRQVKLAAGTSIPPKLAKGSTPADHWHMAYGFYLCDHFAPDLPADPEKGGIHTHADGLIHVEPVVVDDTGTHATVGRFLKLAGVTTTDKEIKLPGDKTYKNGDKCGDKTGEVEAWVGGKQVPGDPRNIRIKDGSNITIAFVPKDTKVPETPSVKNIPTANNAEEPSATTTTVPGTPPGSTATTAPAAGSPSTTAPPTSAAPASTPTTAKP